MVMKVRTEETRRRKRRYGRKMGSDIMAYDKRC